MDADRGISRRTLLQGATAATATIALARVAGCSPSNDDDDERVPNVLVVIADDMRADFLRFAEGIQARLAAEGRTFTAARTNVSLCQPFRVGLLTGQRSQRHLVLGNADISQVPHDETIAKAVQDAGYRTGLIGKYLNGAPAMSPAPAGWTTWRQLLVESASEDYRRLGYEVHDGTETTRPDAPEVEYLRDEVISFVAGSEPWFCLMTPTSPHFPFEPEPADEDAWADLEWDVPLAPDVSTKPSWYSSLPPLRDEARTRFQATARGQAQEVSGLDRAVIDILDTLPGQVLDNTVVIFTSDDGLSYGEHRSPYRGASKNDFYEHNLLVPLVCHGPGFTSGTSAEPVSPEIDIAKTILALAGATAALPGDGVDLRDVQDDPDAHGGRQLLHERGGSAGNNPNPHAGLGVSTATRKLMRWTGQRGTDRYEAYDLDTDPGEIMNWAFDPERRRERDALEAELDRLSPPPDLTPTLLFGGAEEAGATEAVTSSLEPPYHSVVVVDVFASLDGADVADVSLAGDCIDRIALLASDSQLDRGGRIRRRLLSFQARGTGRAGRITVTAGGGQTLLGLGLAVTGYAYHSAVVQTVATGGASATTAPGAELEELQQPDRPAHLAVLTDARDAVTGGDGGTVVHDTETSGAPGRFAVLHVASTRTPTASATTERWSVIASEIGT